MQLARLLLVELIAIRDVLSIRVSVCVSRHGLQHASVNFNFMSLCQKAVKLSDT
jgi:hypothetical protein